MGPYTIDFDLTPGATTYLTYITYDSYGEGYTDGGLVILDSNEGVIYDYAKVTVLFGTPPSVLTFLPRSIDIRVTIDPISRVTRHCLTTQTSGNSEIVAISSFTELVRLLTPLEPNTTYTIGLYTSTDGPNFTFVESRSESTLANLEATYDTADYRDGTLLDLSSLNDTARDSLSEVMNESFTTGDDVEVVLDNGFTATTELSTEGGPSTSQMPKPCCFHLTLPLELLRLLP